MDVVGCKMKNTHLHILGICGTFMAGVAALAKQMGYTVTGCDQNVYPPMSTFLEALGIDIIQGYQASQLEHINPDLIIVGNAMKRGIPVLEEMLDQDLPYISGPQWLYEYVLKDKWVLAVAGTHGKTTTSSMLTWVLDYAGLKPGFLIGGIPSNFGRSADVGQSDFFVVEADEYDSAFFDKRSKFVHYKPRTLVLNNLEFDHADIFPDIGAIQKQFHHVIRTVPKRGLIVQNDTQPFLQEAMDMGCWTPVEKFAGANSEWQVELVEPDGSHFKVIHKEQMVGEVRWGPIGLHNVHNALSAIAAANHAGVSPMMACEALEQFDGVKRRLELKGEVRGVLVYDDFAHHPTAIETTLQGMRLKVKGARIFALLEPRSNTMRMGQHKENLRRSLQIADEVFIFEPPGLGWDMGEALNAKKHDFTVLSDVEHIIEKVCDRAKPGDVVIIMSNGGFGNIHDRLLEALESGVVPVAPNTPVVQEPEMMSPEKDNVVPFALTA
jgi:UDP-N-acetylmuramate: L-alanyl-gamma-D-glutamyl-meso-diaminopimelate ligase